MLESAFVFLYELPRTPNGKIDRKALPEPAPHDLAGEAAAVPRTPVQEIVASSWEQALGIQGVGPRANFFAAGGHSLLAAQVVSRLRELFQVDLPLRELFEEPTVEGLAERVEAA